MEQYLGIGETFSFQEVETKGEREFFISGYISTKALDKFNDLITEECLDDMLIQIKSGSIKIDFEHETIHNENLDLNPVARIIEAKKDSRGIWVKAMLNNAHSRFNEISQSIKKGFLDSFSIAFKPIETATRYIQGKAVRLLNKLKLINVGITGTPVNDECRLDSVVVKAIKEMESPEEPTEETEKQEEIIEEETKLEEKALKTTSFPNHPSHSTEKSDDKKTMAEETKPVEPETKEETKTEVEPEKPVETEESTEVKEELAEVKARLVKLEKQLAKPEMKATQEAEPKTKLKNVTPLGLIG